MKKIFLILFLLPFCIRGQSFPKEIMYVENLSENKWNKIVEKATKEDKIIFIQIDLNEIINKGGDWNKVITVYNEKKIVDFLNKHFICLTIPHLKRWNKTLEPNEFLDSLMPLNKGGEAIFGVFFTKSGLRLHKSSFSIPESSEFLELLENVVNGKNNYYQVMEEYKKGNRNIDFFKTLLEVSRKAHENIDEYLMEFIKTRENLITKENAELLMQYPSKNIGFDYLYSNQQLWEKVISRDTLEKFYHTEIGYQISRAYGGFYKIKPDDLITIFETKYPNYGKVESIKFFLGVYMNYEKANKDIYYIIDNYLDSNLVLKLVPKELNSYAWFIFENSDNIAFLNKALSWSKKSLEQEDNPAYIDTYANLLYKLGQKEEAIKYEEKAISLLKDDTEIKKYLIVLDKMKNGKKTR